MDHDDYQTDRNSAEIAKLRAELETQWSAARNSRGRGDRLTQRLEQDVRFLSLLNAALLDLLIERDALTIEDVTDRMGALDDQDGTVGDGLDVAELAETLGLPLPEIDKAKRFAKSVGAPPRKQASADATARFRAMMKKRKRR